MKDLAGRPFALVGVHIKYDDDDDASRVKEVMEKEGLRWRSFVDPGEISARWKPAGTPSFFIIDAKGVIRNRWAGAPGAKAIDTALEKVIRETEADSKDAAGKKRGDPQPGETRGK